MNQLIMRLQGKGVYVVEQENIGEDYRQKWLTTFVPFVDEPEKRLFLWEYMRNVENYLEGRVANEAFERSQQWRCYMFFQESNDVLCLKLDQAKRLSCKDLLTTDGDYADVYVVDEKYNWTYIIPHEEEWGPYFIERK